MSDSTLRIQADFLVIDPWRILTNAQLVIRQGRIAEIHETPQLAADIHWPRRVILPGLINAHTHLEFSDLAEPFPAGRSFPEWIGQVIEYRRHQSAHMSPPWQQQIRRRAIRSGWAECGNTGTALLVDIVTPPWQANIFDTANIKGEIGDTAWNPDCMPKVIAMPELLGLDSARLAASAQCANLILRDVAEMSQHLCVLGCGVSPHAPYSIRNGQVQQHLVELPVPMLTAMHVAESVDELHWIQTREGAFAELYRQMGIAVDQPPMRIGEAIELLATQPRSLLIHGNYLSESELDRIADASIAIVYCPRTHRHFGHRPYPLTSILCRDIPLLLGTDSRASNPDLNLWSECLEARRCHRQLSAADVLAAVTCQAANVLGVENDFGTLDIGQTAWLNHLPTPDGATAEDLLERLLAPDSTNHPQPARWKWD
ncbi:MAG: amidohydrolase family protein [Pirellulaceae bacterium]|nr:amidohydrolase family protein [Pirellulaceae bacterium]